MDEECPNIASQGLILIQIGSAACVVFSNTCCWAMGGVGGQFHHNLQMYGFAWNTRIIESINQREQVGRDGLLPKAFVRPAMGASLGN